MLLRFYKLFVSGVCTFLSLVSLVVVSVVDFVGTEISDHSEEYYLHHSLECDYTVCSYCADETWFSHHKAGTCVDCPYCVIDRNPGYTYLDFYNHYNNIEHRPDCAFCNDEDV